MSAATHRLDPGPGHRTSAGIAGVLVTLLIAAAGLTWAKWTPYWERVGTIDRTGEYPGSSILDRAGPAGGAPSFAAAWDFTVAYLEAIWPALVVALLVAAAIDALVPRERIASMLSGRGRLDAAAGGVTSLPTMMCTCCTAPVAVSLRRRGASLAGTLGFFLGNPLLNPAVLVFLALLLPWQWAAVRLIVGLAVVVGGAALVARWAGDRPGAAAAVEAASGAAGDGRDDQPQGLLASLRAYLRSLGRFTVTLVPEYVAIVFGVALLRGVLLPFDAVASGWLVPALLAACVLGVLVVLPTAGEIPILIGLAAAGVPPLVLGALLITLPAISLPSIAMIWPAVGRRAALGAGAAVAAGGLVGGAMLAALS